MAIYKFRGRRKPKFKLSAKVKVKEDSNSPYRGLVGKVRMVTFEEAGFIYGIEFDSVTGNLALYSPINEDVLEPVS